MKKFENKTVVITGGSGGIGTTTAKQMLDEGAKVLIVDIDKDALQKTADEIKSENLHVFAADVSDEEQVKAYADKAKELFGHVDIFFNNAGIEGKVQPLDEYPMDLFHKVIDINVKGAYYGMRYIWPLMKEKGGSIIITSSVAGMAGTANVLPYVTSKHAIVGMMRSAALEGAPHKIRVNTINPSPVDNRMMRSLEEGFAPGQGDAAKENFEQSIPLQRYATNEEVANLTMFLASDDSQFITGTINPIDGGMTA
ncbi:MAG: SDR family oxidoreductase [Bacteroidales bacterium]|nr:SDR family oxidoreductase [Bacteroidales bacterium]MCF8327984.1 SDR family oxidoreductase [Bacteroidales bacterium]